MVKLVNYAPASGGATRVGALVATAAQQDDAVVDLLSHDPTLPSAMEGYLARWHALRPRVEQIAAQHATSAIPLAQVELRCPVPQPGKVLCVGLNYKDHAEESGMKIPENPVLFSKYGTAIRGPNEAIVLPSDWSDEVDYEVELVIVIGRGGRNIPVERAMEFVAGFTVGNDVSARDWQLRKNGQWMVGKTFNSFAPIGPAIRMVDPEFAAQVHSTRLWTEVNGVRLQDSSTQQLHFKTEQLVSFISGVVDLSPGDLIFTGTPPGVGMARKPPVWLKHGDTVTVAVEGIGKLTNPVTAGRRKAQECVLVTGGQGLVGTWVVKQLLAQGSYPVVLDLKRDDGILRQVLRKEEVERLDRRYGDISDAEFVARVVNEVRPTSVIHLAGLQIPTCQANPILGAKVNVLGTLAVFEAVKQHSQLFQVPPPPVVYASSAAALGPPDTYRNKRVTEDQPHRSAYHYGVFKGANEGNARIYWSTDKIPSAALRPYVIYGVGREIGLTAGPVKALKAAIAGWPSYTVNCTGYQSFQYVRDVADTLIAIARTLPTKPGAHVFGVRGDVTTVEEFCGCIEATVPEAKGKIRTQGNPIQFAYDVDEEPLRQFLGGKLPHTPLAEAIREVAADFRRIKGTDPAVWHTRDLDPPSTAPSKL